MAAGDLKYGPKGGLFYFDTLEEFKAHYGAEQAAYLWVEREVKPSICADTLIEQLDLDCTDECGEDANWSDQITAGEKQQLQDLLNNWCSQFQQTCFESMDLIAE